MLMVRAGACWFALLLVAVLVPLRASAQRGNSFGRTPGGTQRQLTQYLIWTRLQGAERTTAQYLAAEP